MHEIVVPGNLPIEEKVSLAPMTTLGLGGEARWLARPSTHQEIASCLQWAQSHHLPLYILGGGSNVVVADEGLLGLVMQLQGRGRRVLSEQDGVVRVTVEAGHDWDGLVSWSVSEGLAGIECLSGIPGFVGAAPIQNIGAYGQELCDVFDEATVMRLADGQIECWDAERCGFGYRDSVFKRSPGQYLVLGVTLSLQRGGAPTLRYRELVDAVAAIEDQHAYEDGEEAARQRLGVVRETVLRLRRGKSMVVDPLDPNSRSAGSFFTNPIVEQADADAAYQRLLPRLKEDTGMPMYPHSSDKVKLSAAWLIERCGLPKGCRIGAVGLSQKHTLALINRGGATTRELLSFARMVQEHVFGTCGISLHPEPVLLGGDVFSKHEAAQLTSLIRD